MYIASKQLLTNVIKYFVAGYLGVPTECLTTGLHVPRWVYFLTGTEIQWTLSLPKQDTIVLNWENNYFINMNPSLATPVICSWIALSTLGAGDSTLIGTQWPWTLHCPNINTAGDRVVLNWKTGNIHSHQTLVGLSTAADDTVYSGIFHLDADVKASPILASVKCSLMWKCCHLHAAMLMRKCSAKMRQCSHPLACLHENVQLYAQSSTV